MVVFLGASLTLGNAWAEVFVWLTLAQVAPDVMIGSVTDFPSYLVDGLNVSFPLFELGLLLFGAATFRAGFYPRWAALLHIISIPATMFLDPTPGTFQESIGQVLLGVAVASLDGHALTTACPSASPRKPGSTSRGSAGVTEGDKR